MTESAHPLAWPVHRQRTKQYRIENAKFDVTFTRARDNLVAEVQRMVGRYRDPMLVISTNIALRRDGLPLANQRAPEDAGVAVYFVHNKKQMAFACDRWSKVEHNMQAVAKTIEAMRGIARWGTGDMVQAAFAGFTALPAPTTVDWRTVMGFAPGEPVHPDTLTARYRKLASTCHPDTGGNHYLMTRLNAARDTALKELAP